MCFDIPSGGIYLQLNLRKGSPSKRPSQLPLQLSKVNRPFAQARKQGDAQTPIRKTPNSARRKLIIMSSSDEDDETGPAAAYSGPPTKPPLESTPDALDGSDIKVGNDGTIQ